MEREPQLNPCTCRVWGGANRRRGRWRGQCDMHTERCRGPRPAQPGPPSPGGSRGCSPGGFYQSSVPVEQGAPSGGWVTAQELSSLEPVQSRVSGGRRNNPMERKEGRCFRETLGEGVLGATGLETSDTGSTGASSYCAGTLRAQALWILHSAPAAGKRKGTAGSTRCWGLGSSKQGQNFISLQMKPAGVQLLAGAQPCPDTFHGSR